MSTTQLNLGAVENSGSFDVVSVGTSEVEFAVGPVPSWLSVTPDGGQLEAGGRAGVVVTIDRTEAPAGPVDVGVGISAVDGSGGGTVRVTAQVGGPPQIVAVAAAPAVVVPEGCPSGATAGAEATAEATAGATQSVVRVTAQDSTGVFAVEVVARLPDGRTTTVPLTLEDATGDNSTWSGAVGPARTPGALTYTVRAVDLDGLRTETTRSLTVDPCPVP